MLGHALRSALDSDDNQELESVLIPLPTTFRRRMSRGIDHAMTITRGVSRASSLRIIRALAPHVDVALHSLLVKHLEDIGGEARELGMENLSREADRLRSELGRSGEAE